MNSALTAAVYSRPKRLIMFYELAVYLGRE